MICIKSRENKFLIQDLKIQDVDIKELDNITKGEINTKTLIKIYLKEYENTKLSSENEIRLLINPSTENKSIEELFIDIVVLISEINCEKQIFLLNNVSPKFLIYKEKFENKSKKKEIKK